MSLGTENIFPVMLQFCSLPKLICYRFIFSAIYWFSYEYVKLAQLQQQGNDEVTFFQSFIAGATAGTVS